MKETQVEKGSFFQALLKSVELPEAIDKANGSALELFRVASSHTDALSEDELEFISATALGLDRLKKKHPSDRGVK